MAIAYPSHLPTFLRAQKVRKQGAVFSIAEPQRGYGYVQETGTDMPVIWDVTWRFRRTQAIQFQLWFRVLLNNGADPFTIQIDTENGLVTHTCQFMPDGLLPTQDASGEVWTYSATIQARALLTA